MFMKKIPSNKYAMVPAAASYSSGLPHHMIASRGHIKWLPFNIWVWESTLYDVHKIIKLPTIHLSEDIPVLRLCMAAYNSVFDATVIEEEGKNLDTKGVGRRNRGVTYFFKYCFSC